MVTWGIVGPGKIANKFAKCIKNVEGACLLGVASRNKEKGEEFANKYGVQRVFGSYEEMAKDNDIQAVYIATPHPFHLSCTQLFLKNKKHVLCEKPLCVNEKQAEKIKECAKENNVFLMEAMWTRFLPAIKEAVKMVKDGVIGDVLSLEADFCYRSQNPELSKVYKNEMAGGGLLDVGVYGLHFASLFLVDKVKSIEPCANVENGVDLHTVVNIKYENGAIATISSAININKPASAYIYGTKGYIYFPCFFGAQDFYVDINGQREHIVKNSLGEGFEEEIIEACTCIENGKTESDILPVDETITILTQMDTIREIIGVKYPFDEE
ncbi:MAG: Gfo/Idh/MocA family oxidoreductase [Clostridiales bacterium]|nr:Gfo/Idh/MocA family oxidoreductase [Clostridiales bacterium]